MATTYGLLAELTILTAPPKFKGLSQALHRVQFLKRGYTGSRITITKGSLDPFVLEMDNKDDKRWVGLIAHTLTVEVLVDGTFNPDIFLVAEEFDMQVRFEQVNSSGDVTDVFLHGWLQNDNLRVPFGLSPYTLSLKATCGLPLLKTRPLLTAAGQYPNGQLAERDTLLGGLAATRLGLPLTTVCNLRESADRTPDRITQDIDPLSAFLFAEAFRKGTDYLSASEALQGLCIKYRANLRQVGGRWVFERANEMLGGWVPLSVRDRISATASLTGVWEPNLKQTVPQLTDYVVEVCGAVPLKPATKPQAYFYGQRTEPAVSVKQTFGGTLSKLKNGSFAIPSGDFVDGWDRTGADAATIVRLGTGSPLDPFRIRIFGAGTVARNLNQPYVISAAQGITFFQRPLNVQMPTGGVPMRLTGRFRGENIRGAKVLIHGIWGTDDEHSIYALLSQTGTWIQDPKRSQLNAIEILAYTIVRSDDKAINNKPVTKPGWQDIDILIPPRHDKALMYQLQVYLCQATQHLQVDDKGNETTRRLNPYPEPAYIEYEEMRLTVGDPDKDITGQTFTVTNYKRVDNDGVLEQPVEAEITLPFGDLPPAAGKLKTHTTFSVTGGVSVSTARYDNPRVPSQSSSRKPATGRPAALVVALEEAAQVARPAKRFESTLLGFLPYGPLTVLKFTGQKGVDGPDSYYQIVGWRWNSRRMAHEITAVEVLRTNTPLLVEATWQTPDGDVVQEVDPSAGADLSGPAYPAVLPIKKTPLGSLPTKIDQLVAERDAQTVIPPPIVLLPLNPEIKGSLPDMSKLIPVSAAKRQQSGDAGILIFSVDGRVVQRIPFSYRVREGIDVMPPAYLIEGFLD